MLYKKQDFPESGEVVLCTVKKIINNSVFVDLDEYENKEGIIHISEIAPGRIRTIREYVKEGKKIVCKVLRINQVHNNIELSLRRISMSVRIKKMEENNLEKKAEKMLEYIAQTMKLTVHDLYKKIGFTIVKEYGSLNACFQEVAEHGEQILSKLGIEKNISSKLAELIQQRIKPQEIKISRIIAVKNSLPDGIEHIKESFKKAADYAKSKKMEITTTYLGSPRFKIAIKSTDYKKAESDLDDFIQNLSTAVQKSSGMAEVLKEK